MTWSTSTDNGSTISGYTIYVAETQPDGSVFNHAPITIPASNGFTVSPLTNGHYYRFTVSATNGIGEGPRSAPTAPVQPSVSAGPPPTPETGLYGYGTTEATLASVLNDGWGGIGSVDGLCRTQGDAAQSYACPTDVAPQASQAFQATGSQGFWQSYWTIGAPHAGDTWANDGLVAGQQAAQYLDTIQGRRPDFVVLDAEGFGGAPTTQADWQDFVNGWNQGIQSVDANLHPAVYASESQITSFGLQNLALPLFPVETPIQGHTPGVAGANVTGYIAYYATCTSGEVAHVASWGASYNTVQFNPNTNTYCTPQ